MKIVFFGSSEFAVPSLLRLLEAGHELVSVVTRPDRKKGRHLKVMPTPVKTLALSRGLSVFQPEKVNEGLSIERLSSLSTELFVVVSFGEILSKGVLNIPSIYPINLHASLLPKYRGAAPINRAIMQGETKTGLTVIRMNEKMDAGDIIIQRNVVIDPGENAETLKKRLADLGGILLLDAIRFMEEGKVVFKRQDERKAVLAPALKKEDGLIDWNKDANTIHNMVRGLVSWPCAYTFVNKKHLKIWSSKVLTARQKPEAGKVSDVIDGELIVGSGKDFLILKEVQLEGGKKMPVAEFLRGHKIEKGTVLGA